MVFESKLDVCSVCSHNAFSNEPLSANEMCCKLKLPGELKRAWKTSAPIELVIVNCSRTLAEYSRNSVKSREIKNMFIKDIEPDTELLNWGKRRAQKSVPLS
ncbi:hypothetical protein NEAUS07_2585 [Nematocida ausubeli]|nr:hypothetical protein NEAUS07_2585 [Nematocida ausubeli]